MPKKELTLHEKLCDIQSRLKAPKNRTNNFGKYKYRSNEDILEAVKPLLKEHELCLIQSDQMLEVGGRVYCCATSQIFDEKKEKLEALGYAREAENKKGMDDSQISGTASSYARKYSLNGLFLIDCTQDADTNEHHNEAKSKAEDHQAQWRTHIDKVIKACLNEEDVAKALTTLNSLQGANLYKNYIEQKANERMNYLHGGK